MKPTSAAIREWCSPLAERSREHIHRAAAKIVAAKQRGGKVVVVIGSGPNIHEGVTTLVAHLMHKGVVDGVITSSAVVAHEMAGTLDRVKRVKVSADNEFGLDQRILGRGGIFEVTLLGEAQRKMLEREESNGWELYDRVMASCGDVIIKAAGNMAWPVGLRTESLAREIEVLARQAATTVEYIAGLGADPRTMIGAGARLGLPVVVSVPQLIGGGEVGLAIGDAVPITRRCQLVAEMLRAADVIVESAIALAQEIHDGPFELYTGHGIWSAWRHKPTYSLEHKSLIRIDLDPNLETAWLLERQESSVQRAVDQGRPKAKLTGMPFRMEMSGFARLEGSIPITGDIGVVWPALAAQVEEELGLDLDFVSAPQESPEGQLLRAWIADEIQFVDRSSMHEALRSLVQDKSSPAISSGRYAQQDAREVTSNDRDATGVGTTFS
jgi:hypothetical protein